MRLQLALNVKNLDQAVDFYSRLFGAEPHKRRPGYANFAIDDPALKLVLFENPDATDRINHLGVEALNQEDLDAAIARLQAAGLAERLENETTCCHATQNKVWSSEPEGIAWEWYRITDDAPQPPPPSIQTEQKACCGTAAG